MANYTVLGGNQHVEIGHQLIQIAVNMVCLLVWHKNGIHIHIDDRFDEWKLDMWMWIVMVEDYLFYPAVFWLELQPEGDRPESNRYWYWYWIAFYWFCPYFTTVAAHHCHSTKSRFCLRISPSVWFRFSPTIHNTSSSCSKHILVSIFVFYRKIYTFFSFDLI